MNRFYPGNRSGTQTERASFAMTRQVVDQCDHLIDLHGGDLDESLRPYSYWTVTGNLRRTRCRARWRSRSASTPSSSRPTVRRTRGVALSREHRHHRGKPSLTVEGRSRGNRRGRPTSTRWSSGCLNVMRYLACCPAWPRSSNTRCGSNGSPGSPATRRGCSTRSSSEARTWRRACSVGYVTDYVGKTILEALAPTAPASCCSSAPSLRARSFRGETIASIGVVKRD